MRPDGSGLRRVTHFLPGAQQTLRLLWSTATSIVALHSRFGVDIDPAATLYELNVTTGAERRVMALRGYVSLYAVTRDGGFVVVSSGDNELATVSMSTGEERRRTTLCSPRGDLRRDRFDAIAVSLAP